MAHHLAAVISEAETASGNEKRAAEERAADLIMRLWAMRRDLHEAADPLGPCRAAVEVVARIRAERNPWQRYRGRPGTEGLLADLFDGMARVVVGSVLLTQASKLRDVGPAEEAALSAEESAALEHLSWWQSAVLEDGLAPQLRIEVVAAGEAPGPDGEQGLSQDLIGIGLAPGGASKVPLSGIGEAHGGSEETSAPTWPTAEQVTELLERFQADLARLVEAWKKGAGSD